MHVWLTVESVLGSEVEQVADDSACFQVIKIGGVNRSAVRKVYEHVYKRAVTFVNHYIHLETKQPQGSCSSLICSDFSGCIFEWEEKSNGKNKSMGKVTTSILPI